MNSIALILKTSHLSRGGPAGFISMSRFFDAIKERDRLLHHPYDSV